MKKTALIALILGIIMLVTSVLLPVISIIVSTAQSASVGIIGGADGPTAMLVTSSLFLRGWHVLGILAGLALTVTGTVLLIVAQKRQK